MLQSHFKKQVERFEKEYEKAYEGILSPETLAKGNPWFTNFIVETQQETIQVLREEIESSKKLGNNGESLPFENSPEIYGNKRVEAYKNGYNAALDDLLNFIGSEEK